MPFRLQIIATGDQIAPRVSREETLPEMDESSAVRVATDRAGLLQWPEIGLRLLRADETEAFAWMMDDAEAHRSRLLGPRASRGGDWPARQ